MKRIITLTIALLFTVGILGCDNAKSAPDENKVPASSGIIQSEEESTQAICENGTPTNTETNTSDNKAENKNSVSTTKPTKTESSESNNKDAENSSTAVPEEKNTPSTMELQKVGSLQYYLYTPSNPTSDMPLIIYLHGGTNKKADVTALLTTDGFPKYLYDGYYEDLRAYAVIPKLDNSYKGWADISDQLRDLIKTIHTNCDIDMNKISLTGHSMGGTGTYQLQVKLSNTFACIAPMSGSIQNNE